MYHGLMLGDALLHETSRLLAPEAAAEIMV
jgi:hypothetical protein